jgi:hypothetical protein
MGIGVCILRLNKKKKSHANLNPSIQCHRDHFSNAVAVYVPNDWWNDSRSWRERKGEVREREGEGEGEREREKIKERKLDRMGKQKKNTHTIRMVG